MKARKRGPRPLGRRAMTPAERQARRRQRLRELARLRELEQHEARGEHRLYQPPPGYGKAKSLLQSQGHHFERERRDFGFEEGVFVDGALLGTDEVIEIAKLTAHERQQWLGEQRHTRKSFACDAVEGYMNTLHVSREELLQYFAQRRIHP
jgi:hypothetical protein